MENIIKVRNHTISEKQSFSTPSCYPDSGMYLVTDHQTEHLVYVNRKEGFVLMIAPKEMIPEEMIDSVQLDSPFINSETITSEGLVSESFVLDFSKILLSQKK